MIEHAARGSRIASLVLCLIGILVGLGSVSRWASCPTTPCGAFLMAISDYSGVDLGFGWISALGGLALVGIGVSALVRPSVHNLAGMARFTAVAISAAAIASIVWMYVIPGDDTEYYWPPFTAMVIAILGLIALGASRFLPGRNPQVSGNSPT